MKEDQKWSTNVKRIEIFFKYTYHNLVIPLGISIHKENLSYLVRKTYHRTVYLTNDFYHFKKYFQCVHLVLISYITPGPYPQMEPLELVPGRYIGEGQPCFIIAEIGQNHQGDLDTAKTLIRKAKVENIW